MKIKKISSENRLENIRKLVEDMSVQELMDAWKGHHKAKDQLFNKTDKAIREKTLTNVEREYYYKEVEYLDEAIKILENKVREWQEAYKSQKKRNYYHEIN